jgi:hypothetical protein
LISVHEPRQNERPGYAPARLVLVGAYSVPVDCRDHSVWTHAIGLAILCRRSVSCFVCPGVEDMRDGHKRPL